MASVDISIIFEPCLIPAPELATWLGNHALDEFWLTSNANQIILHENSMRIGRKSNAGAVAIQKPSDFAGGGQALPAFGECQPEASSEHQPISRPQKALGHRSEIKIEHCLIREREAQAQPFITVMDEYGYYASSGFGAPGSQARSFGFLSTLAQQTLPPQSLSMQITSALGRKGL